MCVCVSLFLSYSSSSSSSSSKTVTIDLSYWTDSVLHTLHALPHLLTTTSAERKFVVLWNIMVKPLAYTSQKLGHGWCWEVHLFDQPVILLSLRSRVLHSVLFSMTGQDRRKDTSICLGSQGLIVESLCLCSFHFRVDGKNKLIDMSYVYWEVWVASGIFITRCKAPLWNMKSSS